jgi:hypothetical protein
VGGKNGVCDIWVVREAVEDDVIEDFEPVGYMRRVTSALNMILHKEQ